MTSKPRQFLVAKSYEYKNVNGAQSAKERKLVSDGRRGHYYERTEPGTRIVKRTLTGAETRVMLPSFLHIVVPKTQITTPPPIPPPPMLPPSFIKELGGEEREEEEEEKNPRLLTYDAFETRQRRRRH